MTNDIKSQIKVFRTSDMPLVAYLRCKGFCILELKKVTQFKVEFSFENVDRDMVTEFNSGNASVEPIQFAGMMRHLNQSAKRVLKDT